MRFPVLNALVVATLLFGCATTETVDKNDPKDALRQIDAYQSSRPTKAEFCEFSGKIARKVGIPLIDAIMADYQRGNALNYTPAIVQLPVEPAKERLKYYQKSDVVMQRFLAKTFLTTIENFHRKEPDRSADKAKAKRRVLSVSSIELIKTGICGDGGSQRFDFKSDDAYEFSVIVLCRDRRLGPDQRICVIAGKPSSEIEVVIQPHSALESKMLNLLKNLNSKTKHLAQRHDLRTLIAILENRSLPDVRWAL